MDEDMDEEHLQAMEEDTEATANFNEFIIPPEPEPSSSGPNTIPHELDPRLQQLHLQTPPYDHAQEFPYGQSTGEVDLSVFATYTQNYQIMASQQGRVTLPPPSNYAPSSSSSSAAGQFYTDGVRNANPSPRSIDGISYTDEDGSRIELPSIHDLLELEFEWEDWETDEDLEDMDIDEDDLDELFIDIEHEEDISVSRAPPPPRHSDPPSPDPPEPPVHEVNTATGHRPLPYPPTLTTCKNMATCPHPYRRVNRNLIPRCLHRRLWTPRAHEEAGLGGVNPHAVHIERTNMIQPSEREIERAAKAWREKEKEKELNGGKLMMVYETRSPPFYWKPQFPTPHPRQRYFTHTHLLYTTFKRSPLGLQYFPHGLAKPDAHYSLSSHFNKTTTTTAASRSKPLKERYIRSWDQRLQRLSNKLWTERCGFRKGLSYKARHKGKNHWFSDRDALERAALERCRMAREMKGLGF
ncbi:hypothetical protein DFH27DRAFT_631600 [Peziza echinospora]|nr:hypothetical protein DFH27DRAFT_631600 [Peziza echinospora]